MPHLGRCQAEFSRIRSLAASPYLCRLVRPLPHALVPMPSRTDQPVTTTILSLPPYCRKIVECQDPITRRYSRLAGDIMLRPTTASRGSIHPAMEVAPLRRIRCILVRATRPLLVCRLARAKRCPPTSLLWRRILWARYVQQPENSFPHFR